MLDERKEKAITYLLKGEGPTEVAKIVGVVRATVYNWINDNEFKAELDRRRHEIVSQGNRFVVNNLVDNLDGIQRIASSNDVLPHDRLSAYTYLVDRVLGKTTTKVETNAIENDGNKVNDDILEIEFNEVDSNDNE